MSKLYRNYENVGGSEIAGPIDSSSENCDVSSQAKQIFTKIPERFITIFFFQRKQRGGPIVTPVKRNILF
jgi:hypothetical protein